MNVSSMNAPAAVNSDMPMEVPSPEKTAPATSEDGKLKNKSMVKESKDKTKSKSKSSKPPSASKDADASSKPPPVSNTDANPSKEKSLSSDNEKIAAGESKESSDENEKENAKTLVSSADPPTEVEDEEVRLAMEMAIAAAQNPKLTPAEIRKLVGERNKQAKIVDEFSQKKKEEEERKKQAELDEAQKRWDEKKEIAINWWQAKSLAVKETVAQLSEAALKQAEDMKNGAEMRLYAEQIKRDPQHIELRKKIKIVRKVYKAHKLNGNRIETRHIFKRQRMEKKLIQICDKLNKTQRLFTHSSYNVQEYLKAMMKASKKWRKKGSDEEMMLEAQLCRNMHQMLALEKQKVQMKKSQREMKKYLQRCKGWLLDKKAFCEMNSMTLDATMNSMKILYEDIIQRQDELIGKLRESEEFAGVDLSDVDMSNVKLPTLPSEKLPARLVDTDAMKGLMLNDSIRMKKEASVKSGRSGRSRDNMSSNRINRPELYVTAKDDISVCSNLSDPDEPMNYVDTKNAMKYVSDDESDCHFNFGNDAPWMASGASLKSGCSRSASSAMEKKSLSNGSSHEFKAVLPPDTIEEGDEAIDISKQKSKKNPPVQSGKGKENENKAKPSEAGSDSLLKATPDTSESAESVLAG